MSDKFPELVAVLVRSCLKIAWTKPRASGTSVTDVFWAYNTENTHAENFISFSRSLEISPNPIPFSVLVWACDCGGGSLAWPIAAAEFVATGQSRDLTIGHVSLVCHPSGHESFMSSKTFSWLNFVP